MSARPRWSLRPGKELLASADALSNLSTAMRTACIGRSSAVHSAPRPQMELNGTVRGDRIGHFGDQISPALQPARKVRNPGVAGLSALKGGRKKAALRNPGSEIARQIHRQGRTGAARIPQ
ncbi:hypothetical protein GCM10010519_50170 [Streptomyces lactacystinicus]